MVEAHPRSLKTFGARRTGQWQDGLVSQWTGGAEWDEASSAERNYRERCLKLFTFPWFEDRVLRYRDRSMRILRMG